VIFSQVTLEHLNQHVQVRIGPLHLLRQLTQVLVGPLLVCAEQSDLCADLSDLFAKLFDLFAKLFNPSKRVSGDPGKANNGVFELVDLPGLPRNIGRELRLLSQQKLHRPFDLLRRHLREIHVKPSALRPVRHYRIVWSTP
jgi:hypothetical protein